jgi:hypothetical protein
VLYGTLLVTTGRSAAASSAAVAAAAAATNAPAPAFVPPLERIAAEHVAATSGLARVTYHQKAEPPEKKVFQTLYLGGSQVVFNHKEHADGYGLSCTECHHVERCSKCHLQGETRRMEVSSGKQALHENCIGCHADIGAPAKCLECHKQ